jgi:hypothetical protein
MTVVNNNYDASGSRKLAIEQILNGAEDATIIHTERKGCLASIFFPRAPKTMDFNLEVCAIPETGEVIVDLPGRTVKTALLDAETGRVKGFAVSTKNFPDLSIWIDENGKIRDTSDGRGTVIDPGNPMIESLAEQGAKLLTNVLTQKSKS